MKPGKIAACGAIAVLLLSAPYVVSAYYMTLAVTILAYSVALLGLNLLFGYGGLVSLGHALFLALGCYTAAVLGSRLGIASFELQLLAAIGATGFLALPLGLLAVRYSKIFFGMLTLSFAMIFYSFLMKFYALTGGESGIALARPRLIGWSFAGLDKTAFLAGPFYYYTLAVAALAVFVMYRLVESPFGLMLRAIRDNPQKARFLGANAYRSRLLAFVVSAMFGGAGGALLGVSAGFADPELAYWTHSGDLVFMIVLGEFGDFFGPIAGATTFILLRDWLMSMTEYWRFLLGGLLALTVVVAPSGLIGIVAMLRAEVADGSTA